MIKTPIIDASSTARGSILYYTVYKTTCLVNGKFYVGKHQTKDLNDGYFGSGKLLLRAIKKYGVAQFVTEVVAVYETEHEANLAERILVVVDSETSYNLCAGGKGGFGYINLLGKNMYGKNTENFIAQQEKARRALDTRNQDPILKAETITNVKLSLSLFYRHNSGNFAGCKHTEASKLRISSATKGRRSGCLNGHFGKKHTAETKAKISNSIKKRCGAGTFTGQSAKLR